MKGQNVRLTGRVRIPRRSFTLSVSYAEVVGAGSSDLNFLAEKHLSKSSKLIKNAGYTPRTWRFCVETWLKLSPGHPSHLGLPHDGVDGLQLS